LLQVGLALFPLNPALLWLNRRIGIQRELACDAAVVTATARPVDYAASLTRIAEQHMRTNTLRLALAAWGEQSELSQRIQALLIQPRNWSATQQVVATSLVAMVLFVCSIGVAHAPQLVCVEKSAEMLSMSGPGIQVLDREATPMSSSHPTSAAPFQLVPASYIAHTDVSTKRVQSRKMMQMRRRREPQFVYTSTLVQTIERPSFRLARASGTDTSEPSIDAHYAEAPVRTVPALFSPAYLAVPLSNGWLLIQL